jgi:sulfite reductase (NADPH) hemoprotein beta-component
MAESERYLPSLLEKIEVILDEAGLREEEIIIRMTGCPNGCARPALGEISFIGKAPGRYNLYLGAGFSGDRLNKLYRENIDEKEILESLKPIIHRYANERQAGEHFGDFVIRAGYVKEVRSGLDFHE